MLITESCKRQHIAPDQLIIHADRGPSMTSQPVALLLATLGTEFKRTAVQRILTGEKTLAELSRELDISPSVIRNWKRYAEAGATTAVQASEDVVPTSQLREAYAKIRELERALGRKTMEVEILRAAQEIVKHTPSLRRESGR